MTMTAAARYSRSLGSSMACSPSREARARFDLVLHALRSSRVRSGTSSNGFSSFRASRAAFRAFRNLNCALTTSALSASGMSPMLL
eukprot:1321661-Prymnesium_polylepis.2